MSNKMITALVIALLSLGACGDGNPFEDNNTENPDTGGGGGDGGDGGIGGDGNLPPGTENPTPDNSIRRTEPTEAGGGNQGDGFVTEVSYDAASDTFSVDNLGFDGDNSYTRDNVVGSLGPYAVYEGKAQVNDPITGQPINQLNHRAIYGVSRTGNTQFAIVRTGNYVDYGFGGFLYQRNNGVVLPTSGQAGYSGQLAGLRDYNGAAGLEYTTADVQIAIDFDDFNAVNGSGPGAVRGTISNRQVLNQAGQNITNDILNRINTEEGTSLTQLPTATFDIGPGALDGNGELTGQARSNYVDAEGRVRTFEEGNYYAVISGEGADQEIVGVLVLESTVDPTAQSVRETGGFIAYRTP